MGKDNVVEVRDPVAAATVAEMLRDKFYDRESKFNNSLVDVLAVEKGEIPALRESAERVLKALREIGVLTDEDERRVKEYPEHREKRKNLK